MVFRDFRTYTGTADPLGANRISGVDRRNHHRDDYANENKVKPVKKTIKALTDEIIKTLPDEVLWNTGRIIRYGINSEKLTAGEKAWLKRHTRSIRTRLNEIVRERSNTYQAAVDSGAAFKLKGGEYDVFHPIPYPNPSELDHRERVSPFFTAAQWRLFANPIEITVGDVLSDKVKSINSARLAADINTEADQEAASTLSAPEEISPISSIDVASAPPADAVIEHHRHVAPATAPALTPTRPPAPTGRIAPAPPAPTPVIASDIILVTDPFPVPTVTKLTALEVGEPESEYQTHAWVSAPYVVEPTEVLATKNPTLIPQPKTARRTPQLQLVGLVALLVSVFAFTGYAIDFKPILNQINHGTFFDSHMAKTESSLTDQLGSAWLAAHTRDATQEEVNQKTLRCLEEPKPHWKAKALIVRGHSANIRGRYNQAIDYFSQAEFHLAGLNAPGDHSLTLIGKGWAFYHLEDYRSSEEFINQAVAAGGYHSLHARLWQARLKFANGDIEQAIDICKFVYLTASEDKNLDIQADSASLLGRYLAINGESESAFDFLTEASSLIHQIKNEQKIHENLIGWYFWALENHLAGDHIYGHLENSGEFDAKGSFRLNQKLAALYRRP